MGTFDEAKKQWSIPQPELGPPKPKDKPQPLGLGRPMQFNGVVGRASLPIPTTLTNPNHKPVVFDVKTSNADFRLTSTSSNGQIQEVQKGDNTSAVSIEYVPTKPGTIHGLLHIMSRFDDESPGERNPTVEQDLELSGTATHLEHPTPAPADGSPRPIPDLSAEDKPVAPRQQIKTDLDALSGLSETYTRIVGANDIAAAEMFQRVYSAKFAFASEIKQWVQAELVSNKESEASSVGKLAWKALGKVISVGLEELELGSVIGLAVDVVADAALDRLKEYVGEDPQAALKAGAGRAANDGASALIKTTDEVVTRRMSGLDARLVAARREAAQLAGIVAMRHQAEAQHALAGNPTYDHATTVGLLNDFRDALTRYSDACRAIAATAVHIQPSLIASFNELRMNYLKVRASKSSDLTYRVDYAVSWDLGSEDSHGQESFRVFEPQISGVDRVSEPMRNFITHRKLSDYAADADVSVQVTCKQGGYVTIEKKVGGDPTFKGVEGLAAVRAAMRGAQGFWALLEEQIG